MNNTHENKDVTKLNIDVLITSSLEKLYLGNKFSQWLCIQINTTPDIVWDKLVKDYRFSLTSKKKENDLISRIDEANEINYQLRLRQLSSEYLDNVCIKTNHLFDDIKTMNVEYSTYYKYLKSAIENINAKDGNYNVILDLLLKKIQQKKERSSSFLNEVNAFIKNTEEIYVKLYEVEKECNTHLNNFMFDIDSILKELEIINEEIKQKNIKKIEQSYQDNSSLTFSIGTPSKENENENENEEDKEKLKKLEEKLKEYNSEYGLLIQLVYCSKYFNESLHTIKLGVNFLVFSWNSLSESINGIKLRLNENKEAEVENSLLSLNEIKENLSDINNKLTKLDNALTMSVLNAQTNEHPIKVIDSALLKFACQN